MNGAPLPGFLPVVTPYLNHYGYWAVGVLVAVEDFGIPVPGETILIAAALYAGTGRLNIVLVAVVGFLAAIAGDNIGFAIGHFGGRALALRVGKYVFLTRERLDKTQDFFERDGARLTASWPASPGCPGGGSSRSTRWGQPCGWACGSASATWPGTTSPSSTSR